MEIFYQSPKFFLIEFFTIHLKEKILARLIKIKYVYFIKIEL